MPSVSEIQKSILSSNPKTFADYLALSKKLKLPEFSNSKKIAFLSSFTTKGFKEILEIECLSAGIPVILYQAEYQQYAQEILNPNSQLHTFHPDLTILFVDLQSLLGEHYFRPYCLSPQDWKSQTDQILQNFKAWVEVLKKSSSSQILLHNFCIPTYSPLGILEEKQTQGFIEILQDLNRGLKQLFLKDSRVFVFDYDAFCSSLGKHQIADPKMYYLGDFKLNMQHFPKLAQTYLRYLRPLSGQLKKCIVLDLDNTLWGGVLGEEGLGGIKLGPTPEGKPFLEFQERLLALFDRGIILAINSRNNPQDVFEVFSKHPSMILKEKHFAAVEINWNDKATNLRSIAQKINIGLDAIVYFDDDLFNCNLVREKLPEVTTVHLPEDPALYGQTLENLELFNSLQLTDEDKLRGASYAADRQREDLKTQIDIKDYLKSLQMVLSIEKADSFTIPRIAQLTQKTNQFNMTTRRYLEADIERFAASQKHAVFGYRVQDKFGDLGLIAVAIIEERNGAGVLDTFLMSCRVLGRGVEESILGHLLQELTKRKLKILRGEFIPTEKNHPAKDFFKSHGFKNTSGNFWELEVPKKIIFPEALTLKGIS